MSIKNNYDISRKFATTEIMWLYQCSLQQSYYPRMSRGASWRNYLVQI